MQKVYAEAQKHNGLKEIPGAEHNPKIVQWFADVGHAWVQDDETAWCAAFVGAMLVASGLPSTKALNARSYMTWGDEVALEDAKRGDVVVLWRESPTSWKGHVAFLDSIDGGAVFLLGGNQRNAVSIESYPVSKVLSVRRMASAPRTSPAQSTTLQAGSGVALSVVASAGTAVSQLDGTAQIIVIACAVLAIAGLAWMAKERLKRWARGDR
jgi:uncharacterized protein (TIGR02594 family)